VQLRRTLTTGTLVFVLYFNVSGGAFTTEDLVAAVGPGLALLMLLVVPLVWSLPETLIVAELASMLPEEGGYYRWVRRAFGPFWGFQNGWLTWMYSLVDMAVYPALFTQYLSFFAPDLGDAPRLAIALAIIWVSAAANLRGALDVGRISTAAGLFVIGCFLALALAALPQADHAPWLPFARPGEDPASGLAVALSIALWNYIGWDNPSTVEGEVVDASRAYPRALAIALPLVMASYFVPLLACLAATDGLAWTEGSWPAIAREAAGPTLGPWLAAAVGAAGLVSAVALFNALLLSYSRIPLAMANDGLLPRALARTDARGTPRAAVLVSAVFYSAWSLVPIGQLVVADVLLYAAALFLEFGALVALRIREPALRGAFRLPLGTRGVALLAAVPMALLVAIVALAFRDGEVARPALLGSLAVAALGPLAYAGAVRRRPRLRWR
jgi:amino acid transporter